MDTDKDFENRIEDAFLADRQMDVLERLQQGLTPGEIAYELEVTPSTVNGHINAILKQIGYENIGKPGCPKYWEVIPGAINPRISQIAQIDTDKALKFGISEKLLINITNKDINAAIDNYNLAGGIFPLHLISSKLSPSHAWIYLLLNDRLEIREICEITYQHENSVNDKIKEIKDFLSKYYTATGEEIRHPTITIESFRDFTHLGNWVEARIFDDIDMKIIKLVRRSEGEYSAQDIANILGYKAVTPITIRLQKIRKVLNLGADRVLWHKDPNDLSRDERFLVTELYKYQAFELQITKTLINKQIFNIHPRSSKPWDMLESICKKLGIEYIRGQIPNFSEILYRNDKRFRHVYPTKYFHTYDIQKILKKEIQVALLELDLEQ